MAIRVATFNLKDFFSARGESDRAVAEAKVANVARELLRADADVVALQEVGDPALLERLITREARALGYGPPVVATPDRRGIRNAILTRLPVLWSQVHTSTSLPFPRLQEGDPEPFTGRIPLRRGVVHIRIDGGAELGEIDVLTAHFKSNLPAPLKSADGREIVDDTPRGHGESAARSLVQRTAEALFLRGLVDDVFRALPDHAICVLGDLNDTADSLPVRIVRGLGERDRWELRACADRLPVERRFSCFHGNTPTLIDHVLASPRLYRSLHAFDILNEQLRWHGPHVPDPPPTPDSDHALCVATFGTVA